MWLWYRLAATALIGTLAWEPPYATSVVLKKKERECRGQKGCPCTFFFGYSFQQLNVGSQFADQGLNLGHSGESTES